MDPRPEFAVMQGTLGVPVTVTAPSGPAVPAVAVWLPPVPDDSPGTGDFRRAEMRRVIALPASVSAPRGTVVLAAESEGAPEESWTVDSVETVDYDCRAYLVVPTPAPEET